MSLVLLESITLSSLFWWNNGVFFETVQVAAGSRRKHFNGSSSTQVLYRYQRKRYHRLRSEKKATAVRSKLDVTFEIAKLLAREEKSPRLHDSAPNSHGGRKQLPPQKATKSGAQRRPV